MANHYIRNEQVAKTKTRKTKKKSGATETK